VSLDTDENEYLDLEDALRRIGGNTNLYKRLLGRFVESNNIEALEGALLRGDMEEAAHLVHTLKGVSANLSLIGIRTVSTDLERAIKAGSDFSAHLAKLKQVFNATLDKISEITK